MTDNPDTNQLSAELQMLITYMRDCEARIHKGEAVDLSGLEDKAAQFCAKLSVLPPDEAQQHVPQIEKMIAMLGRLEDLLKS